MLFIKIQLCPVFDGKRSKIIVSPFNTTFNHKIGHFYSGTHTGMILIIVIYRQCIISFITIQFIGIKSGITNPFQFSDNRYGTQNHSIL